MNEKFLDNHQTYILFVYKTANYSNTAWNENKFLNIFSLYRFNVLHIVFIQMYLWWLMFLKLYTKLQNVSFSFKMQYALRARITSALYIHMHNFLIYYFLTDSIILNLLFILLLH